VNDQRSAVTRSSASALRVAVTQFELRAERSVDEFLAHVERLVAGAVAHGAELVVFPELASTGLLGAIYDHAVTGDTLHDDYHHFLAPLFDEIAVGIAGIAVGHGVVVLGGSHSRIASDGSLRNTAVLAHPDGRLETQDKLHLTPQEHDLGTTGGDDLLVTTVGPFTVGVQICADIQFPELTRALLAAGVEMVLAPSLTWNRRGVFRVRTGCHARAIENQLFVVMSPLVGSSGLPVNSPMYAVGQAVVTGPVDRTVGRNDGVMASSESVIEDMVVVTLDRDLILASRATPEAPGIKLHRPDLYPRLTTRLGGSAR
jgi:predicted amidohydrolase